MTLLNASQRQTLNRKGADEAELRLQLQELQQRLAAEVTARMTAEHRAQVGKPPSCGITHVVHSAGSAVSGECPGCCYCYVSYNIYRDSAASIRNRVPPAFRSGLYCVPAFHR
jgi:hypothetical protein